MSDEIDPIDSAAFPPTGFVDRHEAARMLGAATRTLSTWESEGRVSGQVVPVPGVPRRNRRGGGV